MLRLKIVSPEKVIYDGEAESVKVPGTQGAFEILDHHAPIISSLGDGKVEFTASQGSQSLEVHGGFVEVKRNEVCLCVEV
jgi:F-type H+-transporting ATPase subunit epsilon